MFNRMYRRAVPATALFEFRMITHTQRRNTACVLTDLDRISVELIRDKEAGIPRIENKVEWAGNMSDSPFSRFLASSKLLAVSTHFGCP